MISYLRLALSWIAHSGRVGIPLMRVAIAIIFPWIGALKFAPYEADSITPGGARPVPARDKTRRRTDVHADAGEAQ